MANLIEHLKGLMRIVVSLAVVTTAAVGGRGLYEARRNADLDEARNQQLAEQYVDPPATVPDEFVVAQVLDAIEAAYAVASNGPGTPHDIVRLLDVQDEFVHAFDLLDAASRATRHRVREVLAFRLMELRRDLQVEEARAAGVPFYAASVRTRILERRLAFVASALKLCDPTPAQEQAVEEVEARLRLS